MDYGHIFTTAEEITGKRGKLSKRVPDWLRGTILSVTPGKWDFDNFTVNNYYDGYAILMRFGIGEEDVVVSTKYLESDALKKANVAGRTVLTEYGTPSSKDPTKNVLSRITTIVPELSDNGNNQIYTFGKEVFVANGGRFAWQINPTTLDSVAKLDTRKYFGTRTMNCPPIKDDDSTFICTCINITLKGTTNYGLFRLPPPPAPGDFAAVTEAFAHYKTIAVIPTTKPGWFPYLRLSATTKNYIILIEQPYGVNARLMLSHIFSGSHFSYKETMNFDPNFNNRFLIIDKRTGGLLPHYIESAEQFFFFHIGNSFESADGRSVILDVNCYPDAEVLATGFSLESRRSGPPSIRSALKRFVIPLTERTEVVKPQLLNSDGLLFPTINKELRGRSYKYLYGTTELVRGEHENCLVKINVETREVTRWQADEFTVPNGPIFIPRPGATEEDDGAIVAMLSNGRTGGETSIVFLAAQTMTEIARAQFPASLPLTTSTLFIPPP